MLARCSILERLPLAHSTTSCYSLLRIGGVRHYAIRSNVKRRSLREARLPKEPDYPPGHDPHGEASFDYISSWDLHPNGLPLARVPEDPLLYSQGPRPRNRWPTISTLDPNHLSSSDYVNISNLSKPKIICFDGYRMTSSVIEYGRRDVSSSNPSSSSTPTPDGPAAGTPSKWFNGASKTAPFKGLYADTETPRPSAFSPLKPIRQHPLSDEDYVDALLTAELPLTNAKPVSEVESAIPPSPPSSDASSSSSSLAVPTTRKRLRWDDHYPPCTLVQGREEGRAEPELLDPSYHTYLAQGQGRAIGKTHTKEKDVKDRNGRNDQPTYELIPFPPGTKGFFYFYKPPPPASTLSSTLSSPSSSSIASVSVSSFPSSSPPSSSSPSRTSPALGTLRFRVLPLPLTDPRAMNESYDLPSPYGPLAGVWEVPVLVMRERGGGSAAAVESGAGGEAIGGPLAGFWRLLFKSPPSLASSTDKESNQDSLLTPTGAQPLLTPRDAQTLESLLPPFMPRIGPYTKVLQSVLDPFVLDLSANDLSVVVLSSSLSLASSSSDCIPKSPSSPLPPPSLTSPSASTSTQPQQHDSVQMQRNCETAHHKITYAHFENLFTSLAWTHHRGPFSYGFPADIPVSQRFREERPALGTLGWKRGVKTPWKGKVLARFELTPPPKGKSIHAHPQLAIRILKYVERPPPSMDEAGKGKKKAKAKVKEQQEGKLLCRWKPQGRQLVPWHPQRVKHPFPPAVMQVLKERYWRDEWVQVNTEGSETSNGGGFLERGGLKSTRG